MTRILKKALIGAFFYATGLAAADCPSGRELASLDMARDTVARIVDGDTLYTRNGAKLRLLHIDTPELNLGKDIPPEKLAPEARAELAKMLPEGSQVRWLVDSRKQDKYGRILALVFNAKGDFVNRQLVASGLAHSLFIAPNFAYWRCIRNAEKDAREQGRGLWSLSLSRPLAASVVKANQGFQLVSGEITGIERSRKNTWFVLDNRLWLGIAHRDQKHFANLLAKLKKGGRVSFRAYVYTSHKKLRAKLRHPAQLIYPSPLN